MIRKTLLEKWKIFKTWSSFSTLSCKNVKECLTGKMKDFNNCLLMLDFKYYFSYTLYMYRKENFFHELVEMGSSCQTKCVKFPWRTGQNPWHTCTVVSREVIWSVWARQNPSVLIWWWSRSRPCQSKHVCMTFHLIFSLYWVGLLRDE